MDGESANRLLRLIRSREATVGVVGLGYIGLPTASILADVGFTVLGMDVDPKKVTALNSGECYIKEDRLAEIISSVVRQGRLSAVADYGSLVKCNVLIFCVQTPSSPDGSPDLSFLFSAVNGVIPHARTPLLVICESTVPPGTTQRVLDEFVSRRGLVPDRDIWVAHCPERVLPGHVIEEFRNNSRVIGGVTESSAAMARLLYESFLPPDKIVTTTSTVSEFAKLAENTFRDVNISLANELAKIADSLQVDISEVIRIANMHPRVNIHTPGVGVGGHCLPKDPLLLTSTSAGHGFTPELIPLARRINSDMPRYVVHRLSNVLTSEGRDLRGLRVLVLGTSFKENVDDTRNSPSMDLIALLRAAGAIVKANDPYSCERFGADDTGLEEGINWADVIILAVAHREYLVRLPLIDMSSKVFVDGRNAIRAGAINARLYFGVGRPVTRSGN